MDPEQVRRMVAARELSLPYAIVTRGGKTYEVTDHANVHIAPAYPDTLIIARRNKGLAMVGLGSVDAILHEMK